MLQVPCRTGWGIMTGNIMRRAIRHPGAGRDPRLELFVTYWITS